MSENHIHRQDCRLLSQVKDRLGNGIRKHIFIKLRRSSWSEDGREFPPTFQPSQQDKALLHLKTGETNGRMRRADFQSPQCLNLKTPNLQLLAKRKQGTPQTTDYYWERTKAPRLRCTRICAGRGGKKKGIWLMEMEAPQYYQQVLTGKHWTMMRPAAWTGRNFCMLTLQVSTRNL